MARWLPQQITPLNFLDQSNTYFEGFVEQDLISIASDGYIALLQSIWFGLDSCLESSSNHILHSKILMT